MIRLNEFGGWARDQGLVTLAYATKRLSRIGVLTQMNHGSSNRVSPGWTRLRCRSVVHLNNPMISLTTYFPRSAQ